MGIVMTLVYCEALGPYTICNRADAHKSQCGTPEPQSDLPICPLLYQQWYDTTSLVRDSGSEVEILSWTPECATLYIDHQLVRYMQAAHMTFISE